MYITLADKITLSRLVLMPCIVCSYLLLPIEGNYCFWAAGLLCALAEYTDLADGRIARRRGEVSDFGKLADPFCDVLYRISVFLAFLLPAGGIGYEVVIGAAQQAAGATMSAPETVSYEAIRGMQPVYVVGASAGQAVLGAAMVPWLPVFLMVLREIIAGALRAMAATKGVVLAARASGKLKAWLQGIALISIMALPAFWNHRYPWQLTYAFWATWVCAVVSVASIVEYIWVNREPLGQLLDRKPAPRA